MKKSIFLGTLAVAGLAAGIASAQTLADVQARGTLKCGSNEGLAGFAFPDSSGNMQGFDVALCRAVAPATLGDAQAVEFVPLSSIWALSSLGSHLGPLRRQSSLKNASSKLILEPGSP